MRLRKSGLSGESAPRENIGQFKSLATDAQCLRLCGLDATVLSMYQDNMTTIERVQTGVRIERRILKVLKALAEHLDLSLGDLIEGMALHAFEGRQPFSPATLEKIAALKGVYDLDLTAEQSHRLKEAAP